MEPFGRLETLVPRIGMQGSNGDLSLRRYPQLSPVLSERLGDEKWAICSGPQGPFEWVVWHQVTGEHLRRIGSRCRRTGGRRARDSRPVREAWNKRMLGFQGPAQPSPAFGRCPQRWSATCGAGSAHGFKDGHTSEAIWWRSFRLRADIRVDY